MSAILKRKISVVKKDFKYLVIAAIFYISGIIIGIICFKSKGNDGVFIKNVFNYYNQIFNHNISPFSMLFTRIAVNAGYIVIAFILSFIIFSFPLGLLIIGYRGAILGCISGVFISCYGFNGAMVFFFVICPQNLIVTAGIILAMLFNFDYIVKKCPSKKPDVSVLLKNCILGFIITVIGALYEFFISVILIRPMNFYF